MFANSYLVNLAIRGGLIVNAVAGKTKKGEA